ncbi:hypothetical protein A9Q77_02275 [Marinomonas sp. 42_23_T18]|nr:hypothetical protein A9Q77_02275 [Marinomonas sp. 42_23_T18]
MSLEFHRKFIAILPLTIILNLPLVHAATLFETPFSASQGTSVKHYWSGTPNQTSAMLKVRLESLLESQKALKFTHTIKTDDVDSKANQVFKTLVYKK